MVSLRYLLVLSLGLSSGAVSGAEPPRREVEVAMFALPQTLWLAQYEGHFPEKPALWKQLQDEAKGGKVTRLLEIKAMLVGATPFVRRIGEDKAFVESWDFDGTPDNRVVPRQMTKRFIGTLIELILEPAEAANEPRRLKLSLEHHLSPPVMHRINYGTAATGAEREKLSVASPQFEKLTWTGEIVVSSEWRLVANLLRPQDEAADAAPATRYLVFVKAL